MSTNYYLTYQKSTAVNCSLTCCLFDKEQLNLVISKNNRIEIYTVVSNGLKPVFDFTMNSKILDVKKIRNENFSNDLIFIISETYDIYVFYYDEETKKLSTLYSGNVSYNVGRKTDIGPLIAIDSTCTTVAMSLYDGIIILLPLDLKSSVEVKATRRRIEEVNIIDMKFLIYESEKVIGLIYQDVFGRHFKTYYFSVNDYEFYNGLFHQDHIEDDASILIIPNLLNSVLIIGHETISFLKESTHEKQFNIVETIAPNYIKKNMICCYDAIPDLNSQRFIFGDISGNISALLLQETIANNRPTYRLHFSYLGKCSIPHSVTYLDNGFIFIGSTLGASQILKFHSKPLEDGSYSSIVESFDNIGPIVDMCLVSNQQNQTSLVTCSGALNEGSIKIINKGVKTKLCASINLQNVLDLWPFKLSGSEYDDGILVSFTSSTRVFSLSSVSLEEVEFFGIEKCQRTLNFIRMCNSLFLQTLERKILIINPHQRKVKEWSTENEFLSCTQYNNVLNKIFISSSNELYILSSLNEATNVILDKKITFDWQVSCLDIGFSNDSKKWFLALGFWSCDLLIYSYPNYELLFTTNYNNMALLRSVMFCEYFEADQQNKKSYYQLIFCGFGNGELCSYVFGKDGKLTDQRKYIVGNSPCILRKIDNLDYNIRSDDSFSIVACSSTLTLLHNNGKRVYLTPINIKNASNFYGIKLSFFPNSFINYSMECLKIYSIECMNRIQINNFKIGESPRRIVYQATTKTFGIISTRFEKSLKETNNNDTDNNNYISKRADFIIDSSVVSSLEKNEESCLNNTALTTDALNADSCSVSCNDVIEVSSLLVLNESDLHPKAAYWLPPDESAISILSCNLGTVNLNSLEYFIVGTALIAPNEVEAKKGRIIIFQYDGKILKKLSKKTVFGAVYSLCFLRDKLVASINNTVNVFSWTDEKELQSECSYASNVLSIYLKSYEDLILVGDLMRSITLLKFKPNDCILEEIGHNYSPYWMTSIEIIDSENFIGAEMNSTTFICKSQKNETLDNLNSSSNAIDKMILKQISSLNTGDFVNVIKIDRLNHPAKDNFISSNYTLYTGNVSGSIGLIIDIPLWLYDYFKQIQEKSFEIIKNMGHNECVYLNNRFSTSKGFIDGDHFELLLCCSRNVIENIIKQTTIPNEIYALHSDPVEITIKIIEDLSSFVN